MRIRFANARDISPRIKLEIRMSKLEGISKCSKSNRFQPTTTKPCSYVVDSAPDNVDLADWSTRKKVFGKRQSNQALGASASTSLIER